MESDREMLLLFATGNWKFWFHKRCLNSLLLTFCHLGFRNYEQIIFLVSKAVKSCQKQKVTNHFRKIFNKCCEINQKCPQITLENSTDKLLSNNSNINPKHSITSQTTSNFGCSGQKDIKNEQKSFIIK